MNRVCTPDDQQAVLERSGSIHLVYNTPKGRGVFARHSIPSGTIIDTCPVLVLDPKENTDHIEKTSLYHYTYNWPLRDSQGKAGKVTQAVVFGLGSIFNHSSRNQNVGWKRDLDRQLVVYTALRDIAPGEELCISYGDRLTFIDADKVVADEDDAQSENEIRNVEYD